MGLLGKLFGKKGPTSDNPCAECGNPSGAAMKERGIKLRFDGDEVHCSSPVCDHQQVFLLDSIDRSRGINVSCVDCGAVMFVAPSVWCGTCGEGLSTGWQQQIEAGR